MVDKRILNKGLFEPGKSGNPKGKPKGVKNKRTIEAVEFTNHCFEKMGGDVAYVKWLKDHMDFFYEQYTTNLIKTAFPRTMNLEGKIGVDHKLSDELMEKIDEIYNAKRGN